MASAALPPSHPPPAPAPHNTPPESPLSRMNHHHPLPSQFFNTNNSLNNNNNMSGGGGSLNNASELSFGPFGSAARETSYYAPTSGSNSADEEESSSNPSKRGGEPSSKKRRKQSKPLRCPNEDEGASSGNHERTSRYSTDEENNSSSNERSGMDRPPSEGEDSPLNLSREPGEKTPSLRVLGPELMSQDFETGELTPSKGFPHGGGLYQAAAAAAMLPFGLGGHFPFPPFHHPPPKGLPSSGAHHRSQIFNPEAYCELCNKEFCNKYFLKTHKANKHGIYTTDSSDNNNSSSSNNGPAKSLHPPPLSMPPVSSAGPPFSGAFMANMASAGLRSPFLNNNNNNNVGGSPPSHSSPSPAPPTKMVDDRASPEGLARGLLGFGLPPKDHSDRIPAKSSFSQEKLRQMGVINADAFCEICCKEFCNKYFLRVHKLKKHGICSPDLPPEKVQKILCQMAKEAGKTGPVNGAGSPRIPASPRDPKDVISLELDAGKSEEEEEGELVKKSSSNSSSEDLQRLQSMILELNKGESRLREEELGSSVCKICSKDMENKFFLRAHLLNEHGILNPDESTSGPPFLLDKPSSLDLTSKFLQQMTKGLPGGEDERAYLERVKGDNSPRKLLESKDPNRRPASLSRSYCEICKKELCNKYFMKTHMMKMHGINIEGASPGLGNPGGGNSGGGVSCSICKKELCSKYFLKVHLQNSHGLNEDGLPAPKENGGSSASGLFPSLFPPSTEKHEYSFGRHLESTEKQHHQSKPRPEDPPFTCPFCGEDLKELVLLQVHIIRSHGSAAFPPGEDARGGSRREAEEAREERNRKLITHHTSKEDDDKHNGDEIRAVGADGSSPRTPPLRARPSLGEAPPSKASPSSSLSSSNDKSSSPPEATPPNFPNIEMLQRHMLSTQFPGLINPLLSGFSGLGGPNPSGGPLSFPIQKLLTPPPPQAATEEASSSPSTQEKKTTLRRRIFKCPKCSQRFKRRDLCLSHLTSEHGLSIRRKLRFSPLKKKTHHRSQYVRHFMELIKFPTSRARPRSKAHIMQPFLLKTEEEDQTPGGEEENTFVPSLIYLPVAKRVSGPRTVAFNLVPA